MNTNVQPGVLLYHTPPQRSNTYHKYDAKAARILGILLIGLGIINLLLQIPVTAIVSFYSGIISYFAAVFAIIAGAFCVYSSKTKSRCSVITTMVLSILTSVWSFGLVLEASMLVFVYFLLNSYVDDERAKYLWITLSVVGFVELVVAITTAAFCCHGGCCQPSQNAPQPENSTGVGVFIPGDPGASAPPQYQEKI